MPPTFVHSVSTLKPIHDESVSHHSISAIDRRMESCIVPRLQQTIAQPAVVKGVGFFTGADVTMRFHPAPENTGMSFCRVDCPGRPLIPASIEFVVPCNRRTMIEKDGVHVELTEHVLAALAGLQIDNCIVELNAPEPPGCDGSAREFTFQLLEAGIVPQSAPRDRFAVSEPIRLHANDGLRIPGCHVSAQPSSRQFLTICYDLDYGPDSPIPRQSLSLDITPQTFISELAFARTFVLESEVAALKAQGFGSRVTTRDVLVFSERGVIENELRAIDECVRHKILDCIGDLALAGCDFTGFVSAHRSGHQLNQQLASCLRKQFLDSQRQWNSIEKPPADKTAPVRRRHAA
jgi:UDP-3-O-acyl N-acetylglucosamine deacetylase